jgi:homoserine kinase type II
VLSRYTLGPPEALAATGHGFVNETAIVDTRRGRFVVRRNHRRFSLAAHRARHALITWIDSHGVPTAPLVRDAAGETLVVLDGRAYEVQEYVAGRDYDAARPVQAAAFGAVLARYHLAAQSFAPPPDAREPRYAPRAVSGLVERLLERDVMGELHQQLAWYDGRAAELRARLPDAAYQALLHLPIHGDVHADNVRFVGDTVAALLDFDQVAWDARLVDLADALVAFATVPWEGEAPGWGVFRGPLDEGRAAALMAGYTSVAPLSSAELGALPVLLEVLWLRAELGRVLSTAEGAPDYHLDVLAQGRRLSEWLQPRTTPSGFRCASPAQPLPRDPGVAAPYCG